MKIMTKLKLNLRRGVLTTGDVARICQVAPRTVSKWVDRGKILHCYRVPGSDDRRIPVADLRNFMLAEGMPPEWLNSLLEAIKLHFGVLTAAADEDPFVSEFSTALRELQHVVIVARDLFGLGMSGRDKFNVITVDCRSFDAGYLAAVIKTLAAGTPVPLCLMCACGNCELPPDRKILQFSAEISPREVVAKLLLDAAA